MNGYAILAVGGGAAVGAWLRWLLGVALNPLFPTLPLGTLSANLIGGYLMGLAMSLIAQHTALPVEARLAITTGFLGGLTTFSTFSAESVTLFARQEFFWGGMHLLLHVAGSLLMTALGILTFKLLTP